MVRSLDPRPVLVLNPIDESSTLFPILMCRQFVIFVSVCLCGTMCLPFWAVSEVGSLFWANVFFLDQVSSRDDRQIHPDP
jgi:hypothetical protein